MHILLIILEIIVLFFGVLGILNPLRFQKERTGKENIGLIRGFYILIAVIALAALVTEVLNFFGIIGFTLIQ